MSSDPAANMDNQFATDMTRTVRKAEYDSISPTRPELSQAGRTVLITGGASGIGYFTAQAFIRADAATVVIVGRRAEILAKARAELQDKARELKKPAVILSEVCDVASRKAVADLWERLDDQGVVVDVLVLNAARVSASVPLLEVGVEELTAAFEANVLGPYNLAQTFFQKPTRGFKVRFRMIPKRATLLVTNASKVYRLLVQPSHQHVLPVPCNHGDSYPSVWLGQELRHAHILADCKGCVARRSPGRLLPSRKRIRKAVAGCRHSAGETAL